MDEVNVQSGGDSRVYHHRRARKHCLLQIPQTQTVLLSSIKYIIMNPDAGPSSQPLQNGEGSNTTMDIDQGLQSPVVDGGSTSGFKGKAKDIDW